MKGRCSMVTHSSMCHIYHSELRIMSRMSVDPFNHQLLFLQPAFQLAPENSVGLSSITKPIVVVSMDISQLTSQSSVFSNQSSFF